MNSLNKSLLAGSLLAGSAYLLQPFLPSPSLSQPLVILFKTLSVSLLAAVAFRYLNGMRRNLLTTALLFSSLGDFLLALGSAWFLSGLCAFLTAHLFFIALFRAQWTQPVSAGKPQLFLMTIVVMFSAAMVWWLLPAPDGLSLPVVAYLIVITVMVLSAILAGKASILIPAGALVFMISDLLIALSRFRMLIGGLTAHVLIWSTYYAAQCLIAWGIATIDAHGES